MKYKEDEKARGEEECGDYPVPVMFSVKTNAPLCRVTSLFLVCTMYIEDSGKLLYGLPITHALSPFARLRLIFISGFIFLSVCLYLDI